MIKKCVPEQKVIDINEMHVNTVNLLLADNDKVMKERLKENFDKTIVKIKANEQYTSDKFSETVKYMQEISERVNKLATVNMIEKLEAVDKDLKHKFNTEFEQFQQFLKEQNKRFSEITTKFREIEKKMAALETLPEKNRPLSANLVK